jgi:4-alpha-glucanotransferase
MRRKPDAWGISPGYQAGDKSWQATSADTRGALLSAMGGAANESPAPADVRVVSAGEAVRLGSPAMLHLEDGSRREVRDRLPSDVPLGYHWIERGGKRERLIVCPTECFLPDGLWDWGWSVQLHSMRSAASWGIGDLADLRELALWSRDTFGSGVLLVNPLLAPAPVCPIEPSPYYPTSRCFRNPLYLRIEEIPGAAEVVLGELRKSGHALNTGDRIERDSVFPLKMKALERIWRRFRESGGSRNSRQYQKAQGEPLKQFACYCVLAERHGASWRGWPERFRNPDSAAVSHIYQEESERLEFHQWIQWLLDEQLKRIGEVTRLIQDLPIGFAPDGADAWIWQDFLAEGVSVGAPPDAFNAAGQNWGLPPFVPHKLRAAAYDPFIRTLRASLRPNGGLRIDHVMGLSRLFWIPSGADPRSGAYVHYPERDLFRIAALESHRAQAVIIGEDLGTVDPAFRRQLRRHRLLSYGVLWFERKHPNYWRPDILASINTHDLPTIAGLWSGADLKEQENLGLHPSHSGMAKLRARLARLTAARKSTPVEDVILAAHRTLAHAPSRLAVATLEDALAMEPRPNIPGTSTERPNWSIPLSRTLENLREDPLVAAVGREMSAGRAKT